MHWLHLSEPDTQTLTAIGIFVLTLLIGFLVNRILKRSINRAATDLFNDPTNYIFFRNALTALIYLVGFSLAIYSIPRFQALAQSILAGAGIAAIAVGFASQAALSNIIAGVFIVIFKPFRVRDRITIKDTISGVVEDITLRHTVIRNYQNRRVIIPNSIISDEVIVNADLVDQRVCEWIEIGISYDSDVDLARKILQDEIAKHPNLIDSREPEDIEAGAPLVRVRVIELADSAAILRAYAWTSNNASAFELKCDILEFAQKNFPKHGIEIPFPHRTLVMKGNMEKPPFQST